MSIDIIICAVVLLNKKNEALLQLRDNKEGLSASGLLVFPGGHRDNEENLIECAKREFLEEMNLNVEVGKHLYTTDYFQLSSFNSSHQIISIYYFVNALEKITAPLRTKPFDFDDEQLKIYEQQKEIVTFRFIDVDKLTTEDVSLPIDKLIVQLLLA